MQKYSSLISSDARRDYDTHQSPTMMKNISSPPQLKNIPSRPRYSCPLYSDHVARYYQRITDIFEKSESEEEIKKTNHQSRVTEPKITSKTTYKTVLEDVKDIEKKYKKMNEEEERRRPKTDLDHYRPETVLHNSSNINSNCGSFKKLSAMNDDDHNYQGTFQKHREMEDSKVRDYGKLYSRTLELYREAVTPPVNNTPTPPPPAPADYSSSHHITPARYLAANLKTDVYTKSSDR